MNIPPEKLKDFLIFIKSKTNITALELIEKDFYLNLLLSELNFEEYIFKGGTCLAKAYLDYFRFSEDLDFTFTNQKIFAGKSTKSIKKICSSKIDDFGKQLENKRMDFKFDKSDKKYIEIGNNNKLVTFKIYYNSILTGNPSFIKIQINFLEKIIFKPQLKELVPLINQNLLSKEDKIYYKDFLKYYEKIKISVYDIREITAEKVRSLLTRRAIKSRDAIDLLFIQQKFKIKPEELKDEAKEKILFMIRNYEKYKDNFILTKGKLQDLDFQYNEVQHLVIKSFNEKAFEDFTKKLKILLLNLAEEIDIK